MPILPTKDTHPARLPILPHGSKSQISPRLAESAHIDIPGILAQLKTSQNGLSQAEAEVRFEQDGPNVVAKEKRRTWLMRLWENIKNPLVILLMVLGIISYLTGDIRATIIILLMVILGIVLRYVQESRADSAAEKLKAMVSTTATVLRDGQRKEIPLMELVSGDIVILAAGDMIPADVRVLTAKDLFLNQAALTGESLPVEKTTLVVAEAAQNPLEMPNICFLGSDVESGTGTAVVVQTGGGTYFGSLANSIVGQRVLTSFDKGVNQFTWLMISFHGCHGAAGIPVQWAEQAQLVGGFPVRPGGRGRSDP